MKKLLFAVSIFAIFSCNNSNKSDSAISKDSVAISSEVVKDSSSKERLSQFKEQEISWSGLFAIGGKISWFRKDKN